MSRSDLIRQIKKKNPALHQSDIETIIDTFCENIEKALKNKKKIEFRGFGSFFVKKIKEKYSARNPKTGELIYVTQKNKVRFMPSKKIKKLINE